MSNRIEIENVNKLIVRIKDLVYQPIKLSVNSMSDVTFAEFVKMLPVEEPLTEEVLSNLENLESLSSQDIDVVARLKIAEIGKFIATSFPDYSRKALDIASKLKAEFERYGYAQNQTTDSTAKQEIVVKLEKNPEQMSFSELLQAVAKAPNLAVELLPYIKDKKEYRAAASKTKYLAKVRDGHLDVNGTIEYILTLSQPYSRVVRPTADEKFQTLESALGLRSQVIIHPLTGEPIQGVDEAGLDYRQLDVELRKAVIWARETNHPLFPKQVRLAEDGSALFARPMPTPWDLILRDYWTALERLDTSALTVQIEYDEGELIDAFESKPKSVKNYESIVRHHARDKYVVFHSERNFEGIYNQLEVFASGVNLNEVVVLERANLLGSNISGTIVVPSHSVSVIELGFNINVVKKMMSWEEIAQNHKLS